MVPIAGTATALETAYPIHKRWWRHHELPRMIMLDRHPKITNAFWMHFSGKVGINQGWKN